MKHTCDMMVSCHAYLKERYLLLSMFSDFLLFAATVILCVTAFAREALLRQLLGTDFSLYIGVFALMAFLYSFISYILDWSIKAERHKVAQEKYANLKLECNDLIKRVKSDSACDIGRFVDKYNMITPSIMPIPEGLFLICKKKHRIKVALSKHLDRHPGTSLLLFRLRLWINENLKGISNDIE